jgi:protein TonB
MFEQSFVQTQAQTRRPWTVALSLSVQCAVVICLLLIPLLHVESLRVPPRPPRSVQWITQPPLVPQRVVPHATNAISAPVRATPYFVPPNFRANEARPTIQGPASDSASDPWAGSAISALAPPFADAVHLPPGAAVNSPAPANSTKPATPAGPLRISGGVEAAKLVFGPRPTYPQIAVIAHAQGTVRLEAVVAADGSIRNLRVVSGPLLLVEAALAAVKQWRYQPTLLNGSAVEVVTEIDVNFTLAH